MAGCLSVVATPIGCLEDITLRALRVLNDADLILAEDTRRTRALCTRHGIRTPLRSLHAHTREEKIETLVRELASGAHFALVSDAGTPLVSDPGAHLVARAAEAGVVVESIPGPSAVMAALSVAGLPASRFNFEGFLPRSQRHRTDALQRIAQSPTTTVVFESPFRIHGTLSELRQILGPERRVVLCRELTKLHEQTLRGTVDEVREALSDPVKGEITMVIEGDRGGPSDPSDEGIDVEALIADWRRDGLTPKEMTQRLQHQVGWKRNKAYRAVLEALKGEPES